MQVGIGSYTYYWAVAHGAVDACGLLAKARSLGVGVVQICDNLPLDRLPENELATLAKSRGEITIEVGTRGSTPAHLRQYLAIARQLGSPILRTVIDTADDRPDIDEIIQRISAVADEFAEAGVVLAVENHDRFTAGEFVRILREVNSPAVGICLDTVNSFGALEGPEVVVNTLAPWTVNLHVKDFNIRRFESMLGFVIDGRPAGQGRLDIHWLLGTLRAAGREFNAIIELWTPPEATIEETLVKEEAWARASVEYMRTVA